MTCVDRLKFGDEIRVLAPSKSLSTIPGDCCAAAEKELTRLGFHVAFSRNCRELDETNSSSIQDRVDDLHEAFSDPNVKAILAARGGSNVNQILEYIDYSLIQKNPKILCGYSDITALLNAVYAKTGLITYHGPQFSTFGAEKERGYTCDSFGSCLMKSEPYSVKPSQTAASYTVIQPGCCEGRLIGGNLCTLNLLQGTGFMPDVRDCILFVEDNNLLGEYFRDEFDRDLQSLLQSRGADTIRGILFGRFRSSCKMDADVIKKITATKRQLKNIPILFNVDFGHVTPMAMFPVGGVAKMEAGENVSIEITAH